MKRMNGALKSSRTPANAKRNDRRWQAVLARDAAHENQFVYAVRTTGVFCRCSCAARTPNRGNVEFFDTPRHARDAGYRPCKRCTPEGDSSAQRLGKAIAEACRIIAAQDSAPVLADLAARAGLSSHHFQRLFKSTVGITPKDYWQARRRGAIEETLTDAASVTGALYDAGFTSARQFYARTGKDLGMAPSARRKGASGMIIHYSASPCSLGTILVAATEQGVCAVLLGEKPAALQADLKARFPKATIISGDRTFEAMAAQVIAAAEHPWERYGLPLDLRGTAFQQRVWQALREIPAGTTASYTEIADKIGAPGAVRAVAGACAANPVAVLVPCHRVVRSNGALSGYRWGLDRKASLLAKEREASVKPVPKRRRTPA